VFEHERSNAKARLAAEGVSYKSLVKDIRQKKACDLLQSTELTMEEIANKVGYRDVANFYRAFKSWTGLTPRSCRGKNEKR
jgi:AraC-like DNA-binding protein